MFLRHRLIKIITLNLRQGFILPCQIVATILKKRDQLILSIIIIRKTIKFKSCISDGTEVAIENLGNVFWGT